MLGAFTFTSSWLELAAGSDYFATTTPTLFMNLWSLAVEEQFYLLWPLAVLVLLRVTRGYEARAAVALGTAMLSAVLMAVHVDPQSPTRCYGTDTHVMGLMLGAALAFAWAARTARGRAHPVVGRPPASGGRGGARHAARTDGDGR